MQGSADERERRRLSARDRVLHALETASEPLKTDELAEMLGLTRREVFGAISDLDGQRLLLGGLPSNGYRIAVHREDADRRTAAIASQIREMHARLRRRKTFARSLPKASEP